jgi:homopolymeric O-antigen transport system permease protein
MDEPVINVYTPDSSLGNPLILARDMFRDLFTSRELAWRLAVRDIRAQYRQTALGILWAFFLPLANTATWVFLSRTGIISVGETGLPYSVYVFTGTMIWAVLTDAVTAPLRQTNAARAMLAKLNFPREALIVSGIYQTLFNGGIKIALLMGVLLMLGINPGWKVLLFPLSILSLVLVGTAVGLLLTPVGMLYTDVGQALPLLMQFLMYASPVVFPMPTEGWAATLLKINPLTPLVLNARGWLVGSPSEFVGHFLAVNLVALGLLLVVWVAYRLAMPILIERMSA